MKVIAILTPNFHIGPGVLDLAGFGENWWHDLVDFRHQLEEIIVGQVFERELTLAGVAWIGFAEHSVTVAGHNLRANRVKVSTKFTWQLKKMYIDAFKLL